MGSLSLPHSIASREYPYLESVHWLRSSPQLWSARCSFLMTSRRRASLKRKTFFASKRGRIEDGFVSEENFDERFHDGNSITSGDPARMRRSRHDSFGRSAGPKPEAGRFVGGRRAPMVRKFEYERFKEMFTDENLEMTEESGNAGGISSFDAGRSRIAQLCESQPSRLHNRFAVFERVTESKVVRLSSKGNSREDDHAQSGSTSRNLPRQKSSYKEQGRSTPKNLGRLSLGQERTRDVASERSNSNFSSKLQIILNNFNKQGRAAAPEPPDNTAGSLRFKAGNSSMTEQREEFWNPPVQTNLETRKSSHAPEETSSTVFDSSIEDANEKLSETSALMNSEESMSSSFNLFSNAPPVPSVTTSNRSSGSKFLSPMGRSSMGASSQQAPVPARRQFRSVGSRSSPSRASIPGKFSKYSQRPDLNDKQSAPYTSTAESRPSLREERPRLLSKSKEDLELDANTKKQHGSVNSSNGHSPLSLSSTVSPPEASTQQVPPESQANFCPSACPDSDSEIGVPDSDFEISVQIEHFAPPVVEANLVSPLPRPSKPDSDVEDNTADGPLISAHAAVEANAVSSSYGLVKSLSEESNTSIIHADQKSNANVRPFGDKEMGGPHVAGSVMQSAMSSPAVLSAQSNLDSSSISNLNAEIEHLQETPHFSDSATSQINRLSSDSPFEFQYSYTETPNAPILRYRGPQHSPFGPTTMDRPWTGRPPKSSKKKPRVFDSFKPPPKGKKGIKYVQDPGPFPEGQSPKAARTRDEILGEPLTREEVAQLVEKCINEQRQVNLGRDGLTHNMLDLIHTQWKRRRVCKIKCKGVPTVDMNNVYFHLEDKTGGKIIHRTGGVVFLFRGRNYNYKDRPKIPLMLWKPAAPVYPKLTQQAPGGLTKEQAYRLRLMGRKIASICRLGKNGVYLNLVKDVKNCFKVDDLVRIDCRGLNPSDYKKIGAKLKDLVPCVLLGFEKEHILLWRGFSSKSVGTNSENVDTISMDSLQSEAPNQSNLSSIGPLDSSSSDIDMDIPCSESHGADSSVLYDSAKQEIPTPSCSDDAQLASGSSYSMAENRSVTVDLNGSRNFSPPAKTGPFENSQDKVKGLSQKEISSQIEFLDKQCLNNVNIASNEIAASEDSLWTKENSMDFNAELPVAEVHQGNFLKASKVKQECSQIDKGSVEVNALWEQALESGMASAINADLDTDCVLHMAEELAKTAPPGPIYTLDLMKELRLKNVQRKSDGESGINIGRSYTRHRQKKKEVKQVAEFPLLEAPPMGGLPIDELAKLLAQV